MEQRIETIDVKELVDNFALDAAPMWGAVIIRLRSREAYADGSSLSESRELTPLALSGELAQALHQALGQAIAAFPPNRGPGLGSAAN